MILPEFKLTVPVRLLCTTLLLCMGFFEMSAAGAIEPVISGRTRIKVSEIGDSEVNIALRTQVNYYTALKQQGNNFNLLARKIGMDPRNWVKQNGLTGNFVDQQNEIDIQYTTPGAARSVRADRWLYTLQGEEDCQLVSAAGNRVTLMAVESTDIGLGTMLIDVELPTAATNAVFDSEKNAITYDFRPQTAEGDDADLEFEVDHKSTLMSCLAKNYSNPKFNYLWAARAIARNSGDQVLNNYRVRFRIPEMGNWSAWHRSARLYPGQTAVDPFFPIFDLEKVMSLNGSRPAVIEVEYEYETADGMKVEETDSFPIQMLSRNDVVFSSLRPQEITGFADEFDYIPALMTSMTTPADPVVQQLAGRVNGMAAETFGGTIGAIYSDSECVAFMSAMWHFMQSNHVAYQSPAGQQTDGKLGQHVKFARDVLRNRAGTCIDLAVTWASVCEAVGLEPAVILVPGHAFPAVRLPGSRNWFAVESTMLNSTFDAAAERGNARLAEALNGNHYLVDITEMRKLGILGLDLPNMSEDYLTNLGYTFNAQQLTVPTVDVTDPDANVPTADVIPTDFTPNGAQTEIGRLVGQWGGWGIDNERSMWVGMALNGDASFEILYQGTNADGTESEERVNGTWGMQEGRLVLTVPNHRSFDYEFEYTGQQLKLCILGGTQVVTLDPQN